MTRTAARSIEGNAGNPEFATVEEYAEWLASKKREALKKNPIKAIVRPKPEALSAMEKLEEQLRHSLLPL